MSGHGNRDISGLRFSLGSLVAFAWKPEGFWIFQNSGKEIFAPRQDRLINRFSNNNYPDREGMEDELKADTRFEVTDRISTKDHLIKTWPPYERPVPPAFGVTITETNQDPKEKEGKFSGKKITGTLKHKKPSATVPFFESAYPQEEETTWFLHAPEHVVYLPEEDEYVENRLTQMVKHYIVEYTNELRNHAPFLRPLRGEYSPAQWIAEFCQRTNVLEHENALYPENYVTIEERANKTRQFECAFNLNWWIGENLRLSYAQSESSFETQEEHARYIARRVVNAWIASPPHYANLIRFDTLEYKDYAVLDVGKSGNVYAQTFMASPVWLQCGLCTWQGTEAWQVLSWKTVENNRYGKPIEGHLFFKGSLLYYHPNLSGAAFYQQGETVFLIVFLRYTYHIEVIEAEFNGLKTLTDEDFTLVTSYTHSNTILNHQSFFASLDGQKAIGYFESYRIENQQYKYYNFVVRYENRMLSVSNAELSNEQNREYHIVWGDFIGYDNIGNEAYELISTLDIITASGESIVQVDYSNIEILVKRIVTFYSYRYDLNHVKTDWWQTISHEYSLNDIVMPGTSYGAYAEYAYMSWDPLNPGPQFDITESGSLVKNFIDLREGVYIAENNLYIDGQINILPFTDIYTKQRLFGPGTYSISPQYQTVDDYYLRNLLGCCFVRYGAEWIFSAVGYQIESEISETNELSLNISSVTPVKYFLSSNAEITSHLNTLTDPFLVSVI